MANSSAFMCSLSPRLSKFNDAVGNSLSTLETNAQNIQNDLDGIYNLYQSALNGIIAGWNDDNSKSVKAALQLIMDAIVRLNNSVGSELLGVISKAKEVKKIIDEIIAKYAIGKNLTPRSYRYEKDAKTGKTKKIVEENDQSTIDSLNREISNLNLTGETLLDAIKNGMSGISLGIIGNMTNGGAIGSHNQFSNNFLVQNSSISFNSITNYKGLGINQLANKFSNDLELSTDNSSDENNETASNKTIESLIAGSLIGAYANNTAINPDISSNNIVTKVEEIEQLKKNISDYSDSELTVVSKVDFADKERASDFFKNSNVKEVLANGTQYSKLLNDAYLSGNITLEERNKDALIVSGDGENSLYSKLYYNLNGMNSSYEGDIVFAGDEIFKSDKNFCSNIDKMINQDQWIDVDSNTNALPDEVLNSSESFDNLMTTVNNTELDFKTRNTAVVTAIFEVRNGVLDGTYDCSEAKNMLVELNKSFYDESRTYNYGIRYSNRDRANQLYTMQSMVTITKNWINNVEKYDKAATALDLLTYINKENN